MLHLPFPASALPSFSYLHLSVLAVFLPSTPTPLPFLLSSFASNFLLPYFPTSPLSSFPSSFLPLHFLSFFLPSLLPFRMPLFLLVSSVLLPSFLLPLQFLLPSLLPCPTHSFLLPPSYLSNLLSVFPFVVPSFLYIFIHSDIPNFLSPLPQFKF